MEEDDQKHKEIKKVRAITKTRIPVEFLFTLKNKNRRCSPSLAV